MIFETHDDQLVATCFVDYCLPRMTYIVTVCVEWVKDHWDKFSDNTREVIERHLSSSLQKGGISSVDRPEWEGLLAWIEEKE